MRKTDSKKFLWIFATNISLSPSMDFCTFQVFPPERTLSDLLDRSDKSDNLSPGTVKWLGPLAEKLEKLSQATEPGEFGSLLHKLAYSDELFGSSEEFEQELEGSMYDAFCAGALAEDQTLDRKLKGKK